MRCPRILRALLTSALPLAQRLTERILGALQARTYATPPPMTEADWRAGRIAMAIVDAETRHRVELAAWRRRVTAEARAESERAGNDVAAADDSAQWADVWRQIVN